MDEREYIQCLAEEARDIVDLLSSARKGERERMVSAAFLRCLGVEFSPAELILSDNDPPDVVFREARFEVMIILDEGRKVHAEWKETATRRAAAKNLEELMEPYQPSVPMDSREVAERISAELSKKASHYGSKTCSELDALVYIDLKERHFNSVAETEVPNDLRMQGWRSVFFVFSMCSHVLLVTSAAPGMLRAFVGQTRHECQNPDVVFEL
jgi:hypothetical protein